jgi:hypothetical protein
MRWRGVVRTAFAGFETWRNTSSYPVKLNTWISSCRVFNLGMYTIVVVRMHQDRIRITMKSRSVALGMMIVTPFGIRTAAADLGENSLQITNLRFCLFTPICSPLTARVSLPAFPLYLRFLLIFFFIA